MFVNCHWYQWGFDGMKRQTLLIVQADPIHQKTQFSLVFSSTSYDWGHYGMSPVSATSECSLQIWGLVLFTTVTVSTQEMHQKLRFHYKSLVQCPFKLNCCYCILPASLMKPLKEKSEALCHLPQEAYFYPIQQAAANLDSYPHLQWVFFTNVAQLIFW